MTAKVNIEVAARTEQAARNLNNLVKDVGGMSQAFKDDAAGALGVFGVSLTSLNQPLTLVAEQLKESITKAANWGDTMGDLAQVTGATVEETSLMAASFELVGVGVGNIESAMKAMTKNGMTPNLETMKKLSAQYQAIQDPVEKNEFLFKNFGKAGLELAEIMGKSSDELERLERAARASGKVIGGEAAEAAEEFNLQMAIFQQRVEGAQIAVGNALIPVLNAAAEGADNFGKVIGILNVQTAHMLGLTDDATMRLQAEAVAAGNTFAVFDSSLNPETQEAARLQQAGAEAIATYGIGLRDYVADAMEARSATDTMNIGFDYTLTATDKLTVGLKSYNEQLLFSIASANMDAEAALNLGVAMGVIDTKSLLAAESVAALKDKYDSNADGAISAAEAARGYSAAVALLKANLDSIPEQKKVRIEIESYGGNLPQVTGGTGVVAVPRAAGGPVSTGRPYLVGEYGPELFVPKSDGNILNSDATSQISTNMGGVTINVNGAGNPAAVAAEVNRQLGNAGRAADTRIRTGSR